MKKKNIKIITSLVSVGLVATAVFSGIKLSGAFGDTLNFEIPTYEETYLVGESVEIEDAYVTTSSENKQLAAQVIYPDGRKTDATSVKLDVAGEYTVAYTVTIDGETHEKTRAFSAVRNMASQFINERDCVLTTDVTSPENAGSWAYDKKAYVYTGIGVKATSPLSHLSYNGIIDLNKLGREKPFLEFMFTPEKMGTLEASGVTLKLTDVYDESNYVTMEMHTHALYGDYQSSLVATYTVSDRYVPVGMREYDFYVFDCPECGERSSWNASAYEVVTVDDPTTTSLNEEAGKYTCPSCQKVTEAPLRNRADGTKGLWTDLLYKDGDYEGKYERAQFGSVINTSFYGQYKSTDNYLALPLYFDNENPSMWCESKFSWHPYKQWKAFDFNNTDIVGTNLWDGFSTGEVYLDIYIEGSASGANLLLTKVNGVALEGSVESISSETTISMDYKGLSEKKLPCGVAGENYKYRVPEVYVYSPRCGVINNVGVSVYYGVQREQIPVENGFFKTVAAGDYVIEYKAVDENGNVATKKVTVQVYPSYEDPIAFAFDERMKTLYSNSTEKIYLYGGETSGGAGILATSVKVLFDEKETEILSDGNLKYFKPTKDGEYNVVYTVSDYLGTEVEFIKTITVANDGVPTISNVYIPDAVRKGYEFVLPEATAKIKDGNGNLTDVSVEIYVNGQKINGNLYSPADVGNITVEYRAVNPSDQSKLAKIEKQVAVLGVNEQSYNSSYIYTNGLTYKTQTLEFISYDIAATDKASFYFANALSSTDAGVQFTFEGNKGVTEKFTVTFIDAHSGDEVALDVVNVKNKPVAYHNGVRLGEFEGQFSGFNGKALAVYYDGSGYLKDVTNTAIGKLSYTTDGREFKGFGDSVYVKVDFYNSQPNTVLEMRKIGNQPIYEDIADWCVPSLYFKESVSSVVAVEVNTEVTIPAAKAFDVMGKAEIPTITVEAPDGSVIVRKQNIDQAYKLTLTQFGGYKVTYNVSDGENKDQAKTIVYKVVDTTAPEIGDVSVDKLIYKVGEAFKVPTFSAKDNFDKEENLQKYVLICDFEDMYRIVEGSYTFTAVGKYRIRFCAVDSAYNLSYKEIVVHCVEGE